MPRTTEEHVDLSHAVMRLLTAWGVPAAQKPVLVGLDPSAHRRELNPCRFGAALPDTGDVYERAQLLLAIGAAVAQLFHTATWPARRASRSGNARGAGGGPAGTLNALP